MMKLDDSEETNGRAKQDKLPKDIQRLRENLDLPALLLFTCSEALLMASARGCGGSHYPALPRSPASMLGVIKINWHIPNE